MSSRRVCKRGRISTSQQLRVQLGTQGAPSTLPVPVPPVPVSPARAKRNVAKRSKPTFLPPGLAKAMSEWQQKRKTVLDRDNYIYEHAMYTDCTFGIYGDNNIPELVKCHSLYLAKSSPVFSSMFYGDIERDPEEVIYLPDVNLEAFKAMLKYIYVGDINLNTYSYEVVCALLYVAKKYLLPDELLEQIYAHLWTNMYYGNVWTLLEFAQSNDEPQLEETAWKVIQSKTSKFMKLDNFCWISGNNLQLLVQKNYLNCSEVQLFRACLNWAVSEAGRQNQVASCAVLRQILDPVLPHIRFRTMKGHSFSRHVVSTKILTTEEMFPILTNMHAPNVETIPKTICKVTKPRAKPKHETFFVYGCPESKSKACLKEQDMSICRNVINNTSKIFVGATVTLGENAKIAGVEIPTQCSNENKKEMYQEDMTIFLINDENSKVVGKKHITPKVYYDGSYTFEVSNIVNTSQDDVDISVYVVFHKTGRYPVQRITIEKENHKIVDGGPFEDSSNIHDKNFTFVRKFITFDNEFESEEEEEEEGEEEEGEGEEEEDREGSSAESDN